VFEELDDKFACDVASSFEFDVTELVVMACALGSDAPRAKAAAVPPATRTPETASTPTACFNFGRIKSATSSLTVLDSPDESGQIQEACFFTIQRQCTGPDRTASPSKKPPSGCPLRRGHMHSRV